MTFQHKSALVLNADYSPLSTYPLSLAPWHEAVKAVLCNRATVLEEYDVIIHSAGVGDDHLNKFEMALPSVIALNHFTNLHRTAKLTRVNVALRDRFCCRYCGKKLKGSQLTYDHVIPKSRGGKLTWKNTATACLACNQKKANKTPEEAKMKKQVLLTPTKAQINEIGLEFIAESGTRIDDSWLSYLGLSKQDNTICLEGEQNSSLVFPQGMTSQDYWNVELQTD